MATADVTSTRYTPSKKRYDKQALERNNDDKRYGDAFYMYHAADLREIVQERYQWIKEGRVNWLPTYFSLKKKYRKALETAVARAYRLPLPG